MTTPNLAAKLAHQEENLIHLGDIDVELKVELGRCHLTLAEAAELEAGNVVPLELLAGQAFAVRLNDIPLASGEIAVGGEAMTCRLTHMQPIPNETQEAAP